MIVISLFIILVFVTALVSRRLESAPITLPMLFTLAGMLVFWVAPKPTAVELHTEGFLLIGEIALALVLFTDASRIHLHSLTSSAALPLRLLAIGMPLTILLGTLIGKIIFPNLNVWKAALLATILAPTDAALGQAVVSNPLVPVRIRRSLNIEAGLNDGLSMPFFALFIALSGIETLSGSHGWLVYTLQQIVFGLLIGLAIGWLGGWILGQAVRRGWVAEPFQQLGLLMLALMCYGAAGEVSGNGFIATFVGGAAVKTGYSQAGEQTAEFSEAWGHLLNLFVFFIFGILAAGRLAAIPWPIYVYALFNLTLARMLPVAISLIHTHLQPASMLFIGWFGPRGLASIILGLILVEKETDLPGQGLIVSAFILTVLLSVLLHGFSAQPGIRLYHRKIAAVHPSSVETETSAST
jgi:NhaP-type Na+/H+ or K+/H+ antiporter